MLTVWALHPRRRPRCGPPAAQGLVSFNGLELESKQTAGYFRWISDVDGGSLVDDYKQMCLLLSLIEIVVVVSRT